MNDDRIERNDELTQPDNQLQNNNVQHHEVNTQSENIPETNDIPKNTEVYNPTVSIPTVNIPSATIPEIAKPENTENITQKESVTGDTVNAAKEQESEIKEDGNYNFVAAQQEDIHAQNRMDETQKIWQMQNFQTNMSSQTDPHMNSPVNPPMNTPVNPQDAGAPNYGNGNYGNGNYNIPNYNNTYYKESYKKPSKKSDFWKYLLVSIVSSLIGGAVLTVMLLVIAPGR
ncbi:MAG: hypothetical protein K0R50_3295 [Eubacterium sp.]|nr:hypothetical protein [Eubacterium sp.]